MKYFTLFILLLANLDAARLYKDEQQHLGYTTENGYFVSLQDLAKKPAEEHYQIATKAFDNKEWEVAAKNFRIVKLNYYNTPYAHDATYFLGVSYFNQGEIDFANEEFSDYLKTFITPKYFEQAIEYKFIIAENFKNGVKRHMFGIQSLPKFFTGKAYAVEIYDEVIAAIPAHEYAAQALYAKGVLLNELKEYRESVETFQTLIKRFPRHKFAPESYMQITYVYLNQCRQEFQNPDLITFAEINMRKFISEYPREQRIVEMQKQVEEIKELYAQGLFETGKFYERMGKPQASTLYYRNARERFPDTEVAKLCDQRLVQLEKVQKKKSRART